MQSHGDLVNELRRSILSTIQSELEDTWIAQRKSAIEQATYAQASQENKAYENNYKEEQEQYSKKQRDHQEQSRRYKQGLIAQDPGIFTERAPVLQKADESSIRQNIKDKERRQFKTTYNHKIEMAVYGQIDQFDLMTILKNFLRRHPWLEKQLSSKSSYYYSYTVAYRFLHSITSLLLKNLSVTDWNNTLFAFNQTPMLQWRDYNTTDQLWVERRILGYPISEAYDRYVRNSWDEYKLLPKAASLDQVPHRIDLMRLLCGEYPNQLRSRFVNDIDCTDFAPILIDEFKELTPEQLSASKVLLVNVESEDKPFWIGLHQKPEGKWTAYVPKGTVDNISFDQKKIADQLPKGTQFIPVDYSKNAALNDVPLEPLTKWHAVLLARVLPCLASNQEDNLKNFREDVPLYCLHQAVLAQSMIERREYASMHPGYIDKIFAWRAPFSQDDLNYLFSHSPHHSISLLSRSKTELIEELLKTKSLFKAFDDKTFTITENDKKEGGRTFALAKGANSAQWVLALILVLHSNISRLKCGPQPNGDSKDEHSRIIKNIIEYDTTVRFIEPETKELKHYAELLISAARNRFLANETSLEHLTNEARYKLWKNTGPEITKFFNSSGKLFDQDFMEVLLALKKTWRTKYWEQPTLLDERSKIAWSLIQIAEMGQKGLDVLFEHLNSIKRMTAPSLQATFDLGGDLVEGAGPYFEHLIKKIKEYDLGESPYYKNKSPLFSSLALILPDNKDINITLLKQFIELLGARKKKSLTEVGELMLHHLDLDPTQANTILLMEMLEALANSGLKILIHIPAWDRAAPTHERVGALKARYLQIQAKILDNRRKDRQPRLVKNLEQFQEYQDHKLEVKNIFEENLARQTQPWDTTDVIYPLTIQTLGIQHEMQQALQQQLALNQEMQQEQAAEQEEEQEQVVEQYHTSLSDLISRDTIDTNELANKAWNAVPEKIKLRFGKKTLSEFFSLWVGSTINAKHVIAKMQPSAVLEIIQHVLEHRMGLSVRNLPPGFYLAATRDSGLILCFSKERKQRDLLDKRKNSHRFNCFTLETHDPKAATEFQGDFRQFHLISKKDFTKQTLWPHLATENKDEKRVKNAEASSYQVTGHSVGPFNAPAVMQLFNSARQINEPSDHKGCLAILKQWAKENGASQDLQDALFDVSHDTVMAPEDLKAFGQLFHHYDATDQKLQGTVSWLSIADKLYQAFGKNGFAVWKRRLLGPSENWVECLAKREVDAMTMSMAVLKDPSYQRIWWLLVEHHGKATGPMRYSGIWYAYEKLISYLKEKNLQIDEERLSNYLSKTEDFNGQVFLDRLYGVLKKVNNQINGKQFQQTILNHIDQIDWGHSGLYYAVCYESYLTWDPVFELEKLAPTIAESKEPSYIAHWEKAHKLVDAKKHALRFAHYPMRLSDDQFKVFQALLNELPVDEKKSTKDQGAPSNFDLLLRLLTASFAVGVNQLSMENNKSIATTFNQMLEKMGKETEARQFVIWLNSKISLEDTDSHRLHLNFTDLFVFYKTFKELDLVNELADEDSYIYNFDFINACGRALCCFREYPHFKNQEPYENKFKKLIQYAKERKILRSLLVTDLPWLVDEIPTKIEENTKETQKIKFKKKTVEKDEEEEEEEEKEEEEEEEETEEEEKEEKEFLGESFQDWSRQKDILREQLKAIHFAGSTYLPTKDDLDDAFKSITKDTEAHSEEDPNLEERKRFVSQWVSKGCLIPPEETQFRKLTPEEKKEALESFDKTFRASYASINLELFKKLINNHLAVDKDNHYSTVSDLLDLMAKIDNKTYYNEIGQLLGLLLSKATKGPAPYFYSTHELFDWLNALYDETLHKTKHYPVDLLSEILDHSKSRENSGFINNKLDKLERKSRDGYNKERIQKISSGPLPNQYKPILVKLVLKHPHQQKYTEFAQKRLEDLCKGQFSPQWIKSISQAIIHLAGTPEAEELVKENILRELSTPAEFKLATLKKAWPNIQIKLTDLLVQKKISIQFLESFFSNESGLFVQIILASALDQEEPEKQADLLRNLIIAFKTWPSDELEKLADYFARGHFISVPILDELLKVNSKNAATVIHQFETVEQNKDPKKPGGKRNYSMSKKDKTDLLRIIGGIKRKGQGPVDDQTQKHLLNLLFYINDYSKAAKLAELPFEALIECLKDAIKAATKGAKNDHYASARLLACMREVVLRKYGKWANHTQMLDLLYAALHNNESLLHQVRTGQGKSIITVMRAAYLAYHGFTVDIFSAKDSLSKRDHDGFSIVLDGLQVPHNYIAANSSVEAYNEGSNSQGTGAVNYATIGNFSLFHSAQTWKGQGKQLHFHQNKAKRVAFLDECDHILRDEQTQFNYSAGESDREIYNFDEWVYRETYDFYLNNRGSFKNSEGAMVISTNTHLKGLCTYLQTKLGICPKESTFFSKYIVPALNGDPLAIKKRNEQLKKLLTAAHTAHELKEGQDYCIRPELKEIQKGMVVPIRVAKVTIDNQIRDGSTYSEWVQQFLHVRLNKDAATKGEPPDFFVEPDSYIVLSQNAKHVLKTYYKKIEGCSGTAGDSQDLSVYQSEYDIQHVVKMPTHEVSKAEYLPTIYCDTEEEQIEEIKKEIIRCSDQPLLMTCLDDIEVKRLGGEVEKKLRTLSPTTAEQKENGFKFDQEKWIIDTNDSGKTENEMVPKAGGKGVNTFSSRMNRGTDIKPQSDKGLGVIRTYPTIPRKEKQERGRQSRNEDPGFCRDIINYGKILSEYKAFLNTPYKDRLDSIYKHAEKHLEKKLKKPSNENNKKWKDLRENERNRTKYLITRSVTQLQYEIKHDQDQYLRHKEYLLATLSDDVMQAITDAKDSTALKEAWSACRREIEAAWNVRLAGEKRDNKNVYKKFHSIAEKHWAALQHTNTGLKPFPACPTFPDKATDAPETKEVLDTKASTEKEDLAALIDLYQTWSTKSNEYYFEDKQLSSEQIETIYGVGYQGLNDLHKILEETNKATDQALSKNLMALLNDTNHAIYTVTCRSLAAAIQQIAKTIPLKKDTTGGINYFGYLSHFFKSGLFNKTAPHLYTSHDIQQTSRLLECVVEIFTTNIASADYITPFIYHFCSVIKKSFWNIFDDDLVKQIREIFAINAESTALFMASNEADIHHFIQLLRKPEVKEEKPTKDQRKESLKTYLNHNASILLKNNQGNPTFALTRHLLDLTIGDNQLHYLPPANQFTEWGVDTQGKFWEFLARRRTKIEEKSCNEFIAWLPKPPQAATDEKKAATEAEKMQPFWKALFGLPSFIELDYIQKQLPYDYISQLYTYDHHIDTLEKIHKAGNAFNQFLNNNGAIKLGRPVPEKLDSFKGWMDQFNFMSPEDNLIFFEKAANYAELPDPLLKSILSAFQSRKITHKTLDDCFKLANFLASSVKEAAQAFAFEKFNEILESSDTTKDLENLRQFLQTIPIQFVPELTKKELHFLWMIKDNFLRADSFNIIMQFKKLPTAHRLHDKYLVTAISTQINQRYRNILALLLNEKNVGLKDDPLTISYDMYIEGTITLTQLGHCFDITNMINQYNLDEGYHDVIFKSEPEQRKRCMQYLYHRLINIDENVTNAINNEYHHYALQFTQLPEGLNELKREERTKALQTCYLKIVNHTQELQDIAKRPHSEIKELKISELKVGNTMTDKKQYDTLITEQKNIYHNLSWWSKNNTRRTQASSLFNSLENLVAKQTDTITEFYINSLDAIHNAQKALLEADQRTKRRFRKLNKKGHSRLMDISMLMFARMAADFLARPDVTCSQKLMLQERLVKQFNLNVSILKARLFEDCPTINEQLNKGPQRDDITWAMWISHSTHRLLIPKHLHYLLDNITCFIELSENLEISARTKQSLQIR